MDCLPKAFAVLFLALLILGQTGCADPDARQAGEPAATVTPDTLPNSTTDSAYQSRGWGPQ